MVTIISILAKDLLIVFASELLIYYSLLFIMTHPTIGKPHEYDKDYLKYGIGAVIIAGVLILISIAIEAHYVIIIFLCIHITIFACILVYSIKNHY